MSAQQQGEKAGAKVDSYADALKNSSWRDVGAKGGKKIDEARTTFNQKYTDSNGKTPEDHFKELYGATASLVGHTYDYAWSWVPFTKQKAKEAKAKAQSKDLDQLKEDAKSKGIQVKDDAMQADVTEEAKQTVFTLIDESRALVGKILDTAIYYIKVGEEKVQEGAEQAQGEIKKGQHNASAHKQTYVDQARNLTAYVLERSEQVITYGQKKAQEAVDQAKGQAKSAKDQVNGAVDDASAEAHGHSGSRPGFTISANL